MRHTVPGVHFDKKQFKFTAIANDDKVKLETKLR